MVHQIKSADSEEKLEQATNWIGNKFDTQKILIVLRIGTPSISSKGKANKCLSIHRKWMIETLENNYNVLSIIVIIRKLIEEFY
jgi:hypothetical protein